MVDEVAALLGGGKRAERRTLGSGGEATLPPALLAEAALVPAVAGALVLPAAAARMIAERSAQT